MKTLARFESRWTVSKGTLTHPDEITFTIRITDYAKRVVYGVEKFVIPEHSQPWVATAMEHQELTAFAIMEQQLPSHLHQLLACGLLASEDGKVPAHVALEDHLGGILVYTREDRR